MISAMFNRGSSRTLSRYLLRELVTIFGLSLVALSLLFLLILGIQAVQGGYSLRIILPWMVESLGYSCYFTVPLSLMVASTLGYGRFVADREYTAAVASGISPLSIARPMLLLAAALCVVGLATQGTVLPHAHYKQRNITRYLVKQLEHLGDSRKGKLQIDKEGGVVHWDEIEEGRYLKGVSIEKRIPLENFTSQVLLASSGPIEVPDAEPDLPTPPTKIRAKRATLEVQDEEEVILFTLSQVQISLPEPQRGYLFPKAGITKYDRLIDLHEIELKFPINEKAKREGDWTNSELNRKSVEYRQLAEEARETVTSLAAHRPPADPDRELSSEERAYEEAAASVRYYERRIGKAKGEIWERRALALSIFTFGFLGFPISVAFRHRHKMVPFFIGVLLVIAVFFPLLLLGESLVKDQGVPAPFALMMGNIVLLLFGLLLTGRVARR
jgi:lipopolysaccharide export LptBFGC system permease protein LptF